MIFEGDRLRRAFANVPKKRRLNHQAKDQSDNNNRKISISYATGENRGEQRVVGQVQIAN